MARRTALEFYRKRQTIESLATERPQSLKSVYDIINNAVERLEEKVEMLMTSYYGADETLDAQMKKWLPMFLLLLRQGRTMELVCKEQVNEFVIKHDNLLERSPFDQDLLDSVDDIINHIFCTIREGFTPITSSIQELVGFMGKYLKSFSPTDGDRYLETCTNYEKQKNALENAILLNIQNIFLMADKFEKECLTRDHFDYVSKERIEKYGCLHVPVLLVLPAACDNLRNAFVGIRKWLEADANYVDYLVKDVHELERKREIESRELKELQFRVSGQEYKFKCLKKEIDQLTMELDRLKSKELVINEEEKTISNNHKNLNVDLEIKLYRLSEMKQTTPRKPNRLFKEQLERLNTEITLLKDKQPKLDRSLTDIQSKKSWISEKRQEKNEKEAQLEEVRNERRKVKKLARKSEVEILRIADCIHKLKDIKNMKNSDEILRRLFHNLPIFSRNLHNTKKRGDKLDRAITLVSRYIDSDWIKLYWQLPFYPIRGEETKRQDIEDIAHNFIRHVTEDQAKQCLLKWRRLHTRATLACLRDALSAMRRKDIIDILDKELKPRPQCSVNPKLYRTVHFPEILVVDCHLI
ncbi:hypothetical protein LOTGIDRAFT_235493 [Lottia gigantea]|uniref:Death domain-containing protein n=1 Tax=Lottia gigantea TaxID=225164 RepID=V4BB79_LOTGI|nr:hypothetical protein LOTGIDRAFT_235493 [Lottia gigantea]ESO86259.1 hypothetical protein LOTGIDRAFT_235493 [Lottia gigantea]